MEIEYTHTLSREKSPSTEHINKRKMGNETQARDSECDYGRDYNRRKIYPTNPPNKQRISKQIPALETETLR